MKNANMTEVLKKAMEDFEQAYLRLRTTMERYEQTTGKSVNDLRGFTEKYPFDKSFDELTTDVDAWVSTVVENLLSTKFTVLNYEYLNTGGNTMVGISEVWLPEENRTVYVYTNEEGCTITTVDYIRNDIQLDDYDECVVDYADWGRVTGDEKHFELYRHCLNTYTKDDCKYFGITRGIQYHLLSDELQKQVDADYLVWLESESNGLVDTDGVNIIVQPDYESVTEDDKLLATIKEFKCWHSTIAGDEEYYDKYYTLSLGNNIVQLPYNADVWDAVDTALKTVIENW